MWVSAPGIDTSSTRGIETGSPVMAGVQRLRNASRTSAIGNSHCGARACASLVSMSVFNAALIAITVRLRFEWSAFLIRESSDADPEVSSVRQRAPVGNLCAARRPEDEFLNGDVVDADLRRRSQRCQGPGPLPASCWRDILNIGAPNIRTALGPASRPQDLPKTWIFAQVSVIWPVLGGNQSRIADCVGLFFKSNGFVVLSGCPRCPTHDGGCDILPFRSPSKLHVKRLGIGLPSQPCVGSSECTHHPRGSARHSEHRLGYFCRFLRSVRAG